MVRGRLRRGGGWPLTCQAASISSRRGGGLHRRDRQWSPRAFSSQRLCCLVAIHMRTRGNTCKRGMDWSTSRNRPVRLIPMWSLLGSLNRRSPGVLIGFTIRDLAVTLLREILRVWRGLEEGMGSHLARQSKDEPWPQPRHREGGSLDRGPRPDRNKRDNPSSRKRDAMHS